MLLSTLTAAQAQTSETFAPKAGDLSFEVMFNPLSNSKNSFQIDGLRLRYFLDNESALRANLDLGFMTNKDYNRVEKDDFEKDNYTKNVNSDWSLGLGYEKHHSIAPRLDVYLGGEAGIAKTNAKTVNSSVIDDETVESTSKSGTFGWYASALTGFDFYVYRGLYLGSELGLRFSHSKKGLTTVKNDGDKTKYKEPDTNSRLAIFVSPCIRLGWTF